MGKYQAYPTYKASEIEWVGDYPDHWTLTRVKYESYVKARVGWHGLKSDDFTEEGPYLVTGSDFKGPIIQWENCYHCDLSRYHQDPYIQLKEGDLLITKDGTIGKVALVTGLDGLATLNSGVFVVRPLSENYESRFYFWLLQSAVFTGFVDFNKTGSTIVHLYQDTFVNFSFAMPDSDEQLSIANFLDHETAKIDTLIEKQQQLIQLLKEKRQAVISHAVTKGLNPDAPMKDSGVEWVDIVPVHWNVTKLRHYADVSNGATPNRENMSFWENGSIGWLNSSKVNDIIIEVADQFITELAVSNTSVKFVNENDLVMAITGEGQTRGRVAICKISATINQHLAAISIKDRSLSYEYLYIWLVANYDRIRFESEGAGSTKGAIRCEDIGAFPIIIPPMEEQTAIIYYVKNENLKFEELEINAISAIELMQERRTALISAAVTGKIDVRNWQGK